MTTETRTQTIIRNTRDCFSGREEWLKILTFRVMETYHNLVPFEHRTHHFNNTDDALRDLTNNKKFIERCMNGEIRFPADMEEAWVLSLDEPCRSRCIAELAHRYGLMPVYENDLQLMQTTILHNAKLMKETSEALEVVAKMEMDGRLDHLDLPHLEIALNELDDVASCALSMKRTLAAKITCDARARH